MQDYSKAHNELFDTHEHHTEEIHHIKMKLANLEDLCRRNNIVLYTVCIFLLQELY